MMLGEEGRRNRLKGMKKQMEMAEQLLSTHPLTADRLSILQSSMNLFRTQAIWSESGPLARFMILLDTALISPESQNGPLGFMGPYLLKLERYMEKLVASTLPIQEAETATFIALVTEVMGIGLIAYLNHRMGQWKTQFSQEVPEEAKRASMLLKEMGLGFILGTQVIDHIFQDLSKTLELNERQQKEVAAIGMAYLLTLLYFYQEVEMGSDKSFLTMLLPFMTPVVTALEPILQNIEERIESEGEAGTTVLSQLHLLRRDLEEGDVDNLYTIIEGICESADASIDNLIKEMKELIDKCSLLTSSLEIALTRRSTPAATVTQAA